MGLTTHNLEVVRADDDFDLRLDGETVARVYNPFSHLGRHSPDDADKIDRAEPDALKLARQLAASPAVARAVEEILREATAANDVIRFNRDGQGQGRIRVATAMHRIARLAEAALADAREERASHGNPSPSAAPDIEPRDDTEDDIQALMDRDRE